MTDEHAPAGPVGPLVGEAPVSAGGGGEVVDLEERAEASEPEVASAHPELEAGDGISTDTERTMLAGILPGSGGRKLEGRAKKILRGSTPLGAFTVDRMLGTPNARESALLTLRGRVAFVDASAMTVAMYFNELGKAKPNKTILDGCAWAMSHAGIAVDSVPISTQDRDRQMADDRKAASMTNAELMQRQADRLRALQEGPAKASA